MADYLWAFGFRRRMLVFLGLAFALASRAETLETFQHTSYSRHNGAPGDVTAMTQDEDGFLWIAGAATKGIVRFDGVSFEPYLTLPGQKYQQDQIGAVFPAEGGGVWMADSDASGPSLAKDGKLTAFGQKDGYEGISPSFYKGPNGHVRSVSNKGINEFADGRWKFVLPLREGFMAAVDDDGQEWIIDQEKLWVRRTQNSPLETPPGAPDRPWTLTIGASGRMYFADPKGVRIFRRAGVTLKEATQPILAPPNEMIESRAGSLWLGTHEKVLFASADALADAETTHSAPATEAFTAADGLGGSNVSHLLEDRDGDIWIGTEGGVDVFRRTAFVNVRLPPGMSHVSVVTDSHSNTWVASGTDSILRRHATGSWAPIGPRQSTFATVLDRAHDIGWALNQGGLWRLAAGEDAVVAPYPYPEWDAQTDCLVVDATGKVYACPLGYQRDAPLRPKVWDGRSWTDLPGLPGRATTGAFDAQGVLWFALSYSASVARLVRDQFEIVGPEQGLVIGQVTVLTPDGNGLWFGGEQGIQYFDGARFWPLATQGSWPLKSVVGIVVDPTGYFWVQTIDGVLRSRERNLATTIRSSNASFAFDHFGLSDGVDGAPDMSVAMPALRLGGDDHLWLQTLSGLAWIDPASPPVARAPPMPRIDAVRVQGRTVIQHVGDVRLTAEERDLRIAYSSATITKPDQVRFAYRLAGLDDDWTDAGPRREATFTNLPAGDFRFEVKALLEAGLSSPIATLGIERVPAFSETWWFRALFVVPALALIWLVYALRTRAIARKLKIRADEREAVARDIHDTLLQRFQGVMLTMQAWALDAQIPQDKRGEMMELSSLTRDALLEGRERIAILRGGPDHGLSLYDAILNEGQRLAAMYGQAFAVNVAGISKALRKEAESELLIIAIEAMRNAFMHSGGTRVSVDISYEDDALWFVISDNGRGIDEQALAMAPQKGHFGMVGLRERVGALNGMVRIDSTPGEGTELHVRVPRRVAYGK